MRGVQFGEFHTADDWGLILNSKDIKTPTRKIVKVSVDGRDGDINLSRALTGEMRYNNREASFTFLVTEGSYEEREELLDEIRNNIDGYELQIIDPDKPDYYLVGECGVSDVVNNKAYGSFKITADCEPYYYAKNETRRVVTLTATDTEINLTNKGRKTLSPTVIVEGEATIGYGATVETLGTGTYKLTSLYMRKGVTTVTVRGSGSVTFVYREAVL